ncbi:MAG TPA: hypothetical protein VE010_18875 [Thermoanaerobaculia bacterium]|nr:hypothetical protein [Thermoanaerobaculia bacterium]
MNRKHEELLDEIAHQAMIDKGLDPDFNKDVRKQLDGIRGPARIDESIRDLRHYGWCSIDNDDSRDIEHSNCEED